MKKLSLLIFLLIILIPIISCDYSAEIQDLKRDFWVRDYANILTNDEIFKLAKLLYSHEKTTGVELILITTPKLKNETIKKFSLRHARKIGAGKPGLNNGGLIVIALEDKKFRIETGYGLEWPIGDEKCHTIIKQMIPYFRQKKYYQGINAGFRNMINLSKNLTWEIDYYGLKDVLTDGRSSIGKIVSFRGTKYHSQRNKLYLKSEGVDIQLNATKYMGELINRISNSGTKVKIIARVKEFEPLVFELMGVIN